MPKTFSALSVESNGVFHRFVGVPQQVDNGITLSGVFERADVRAAIVAALERPAVILRGALRVLAQTLLRQPRAHLESPSWHQADC